ncbi:MAG: DMT family transporter [Bdellovibrionales bacterium]|nr:DMT family transporter [Bdellovibrionales bacterium]
MSRFTASAELFVAAALWGFGFIAAVWAMREINAFELTFMRYFLAFLVVVPFLLVPRFRRGFVENVRKAFWPGVFFAATLVTQTWGLQYTTATKSGFITTLYVVLVPLLESYMHRRRLPVGIWTCVGVSLLGTGMIVNVGFGEINKGDLLTLLCAFLAAGQIYIIGVVSPSVRNPFLFNGAQCMWAGLFCLPFVLNAATWEKMARFAAWGAEAKAGLLILGLGSTVIAFSLQVRAQARLSATVSSLLFLLESPFAMIFAFFLLGESLGRWETLGAILIFMSALAASQLEARRKKV